MTTRRLFWVAIGAGLASIAFLLAQFLPLGRQDPRFLTIRSQNGPPNADAIIAAVGQCMGGFGAILTAHGTTINLPLKSLSKRDFICLTEKLGGAKYEIYIREHEMP